MNKRGLIGKIILVVFLVLVVGLVAGGLYLYNFHVFKEIRICVGEGNNTMIPCETRENCLEIFNISLDELEGAPEFLRRNVVSTLDKAVYCSETCFFREVRGIDFEGGGIEELESCESGEEEIVMEIRGKEGLEILKWMKSEGNI